MGLLLPLIAVKVIVAVDPVHIGFGETPVTVMDGCACTTSKKKRRIKEKKEIKILRNLKQLAEVFIGGAVCFEV